MYRFVVLTIWLALAPRAQAEDDPLAGVATVTFDEAVPLAGALPEVAAQRAAADATRAASDALPVGWSPLALRVMPQRAFGTPRGAGVRLGAEQAIPLASRRDAARTSLRALAEQRAWQARALTIEAQLEIARVWIDSWAAGEALAHAQAARDVAARLVEVTARGRAAGAATAPELADARALLASARTAVLDTEGRARDAGYALGAAIGADGPRRASGGLPAVEVPDDAGAQIAATEHLPAVRARRIAALAARARALEARRLRAPELLVGGELTLDPGGDHRVSATLGLAWPAYDRGEREQAEARAEATALDGEAAELARRARFALAQALHDVAHTQELLDEVERELLPAVEDAAQRRRRAFELGESTVLEVLSAERAAIAGRQTALEARAGRAWARVHAHLLLAAGVAP